MARQSNLWLSLWMGSVLVIFVGLGGAVMYRLGFFSLSGSDASSKVVAAALTLVGAIIGAAVSMVGVLLKKNSIDERNADLRTDAEQRLKLEAALRTLQLFSTAAGAPAPKEQRDGALFALSSLGQHDLTLFFAENLIESGDLHPNMFTTLLNGAILQGSDEIKEGAITLYHRRAARMLIPNGIAVPRALLMWKPGLPECVRRWGALAVAEAIMARSFTEWMEGDLRLSFNTALGILCLAWEVEENQRLKDSFGVILGPLCEAVPAVDYMYHPSKQIDVASIKKQIAEAKADSQYINALAERLSVWATKSEKLPSEPAQSKDSDKRRRAHGQGR